MRHRFGTRRPLKGRLIVFLLLVVALVALFNHTLYPVMQSEAENEAKVKAISVIDNIVLHEISSNSVTYESLIHVERDSAGKVLSITTDIVKMNLLKTKIMAEVQNAFNSDAASDVKVPLGTLLGGSIFYGRGPNVTLNITLSGNVDAEFKSSLTSAGINQTRHQIYLNVGTNVYSFLPGISAATKVNTDVLVAETVIVGTVPNTVLNFDK
jgi:sporulation protein YunB